MQLDRISLNIRTIFVVVAVFLGLVVAGPALAQDDTVSEPEDETSYFNNAAQAAKAQNLAAISEDMAANDEEAQAALDEAESNLEAAQTAASDADTALQEIADTINPGLPEDATPIDPEQLAETAAADPNQALQDIVDAINQGLPEDGQITVADLTAAPGDYGFTQDQLDAVENYGTTQSNLEQAQTDFETALANASGVSVAEIADMRAAGMGWGVIAHELGIHPSALGLGNKFGHTRQNREKTMAARGYGHGKKAGMLSSTARDLKTGGNAYGKSKSNQGQGKGADKTGGVGKSNGKSNGKGNQGGGKGNSGGKGNNGNGKGNNKN